MNRHEKPANEPGAEGHSGPEPPQKNGKPSEGSAYEKARSLHPDGKIRDTNSLVKDIAELAEREEDRKAAIVSRLVEAN